MNRGKGLDSEKTPRMDFINREATVTALHAGQAFNERAEAHLHLCDVALSSIGVARFARSGRCIG